MVVVLFIWPLPPVSARGLLLGLVLPPRHRDEFSLGHVLRPQEHALAVLDLVIEVPNDVGAAAVADQ